jgi:hypothetical protein
MKHSLIYASYITLHISGHDKLVPPLKSLGKTGMVVKSLTTLDWQKRSIKHICQQTIESMNGLENLTKI